MDNFFDIKNCERCNDVLKARITSWFTEQTICINCSKQESDIRSKLKDGGKHHEGCGYVPVIHNPVTKKPVVKLSGRSGNAFAIMGDVIIALKKANYSREQIAKYQEEAMGSDYENLLKITHEWVEVE